MLRRSAPCIRIFGGVSLDPVRMAVRGAPFPSRG
jgi:hypothetical protein